MFFFLFLSLSALNFIVLFRNPTYAVFCFIFFIFSVISLLLYLKIEFLSYLLLIIYIGAIAVLFLFTVILLNIKEAVGSSFSIIKETVLLFCLFLLVIIFINSNILQFCSFDYLLEQTILYTDPILMLFFSLDVNYYIYFFQQYGPLLLLTLFILLSSLIGITLYLRN